jgi:hypothetical protein
MQDFLRGGAFFCFFDPPLASFSAKNAKMRKNPGNCIKIWPDLFPFPQRTFLYNWQLQWYNSRGRSWGKTPVLLSRTASGWYSEWKLYRQKRIPRPLPWSSKHRVTRPLKGKVIR